MRTFCAHIAVMSYVDKIISQFGGVRPMAAKIGKSPSTVQSWKDRQSIPDDQKTVVWGKAQEHGVGLAEIDFVPFPTAPKKESAAE